MEPTTWTVSIVDPTTDGDGVNPTTSTAYGVIQQLRID